MTQFPSRPARVLVTGGAGYIGSHCCKALSRAGMVPVVYDNLSRGHADAVRWGAFMKGDLRDRARLVQVLRDERIDAVIHFAAFAYVGESVHEPQMYYDNNVGGMIALLGAMQEMGVKTLVFSSSCATYGVPTHMPIDETMAQAPINPYGRSKLICEWMMEDAATAWGLSYAALRYFNAAGSDPEFELSERHDPETHLIPLALMAAEGTGAPLQVFGTDYPTPDGTCVRDYIHVGDLARAHVLALDALRAGAGPLKLNLGTGKGTSVQEILDAVERVTGHAVPHIDSPRRAGDPPELVANPARAREALGFEAQWTNIDEIVGHAAPWFAERPVGAPKVA
ncbi:UDP-glucose 4-epimerase GalE [Celeribacter ethanolicus]|uniref:UDP-glucose 4-epimerase n=1 Tax=Celeribacter ethanolicus TaxID=1758178 RepID=A0A291GAH6_9RHOB|nr:UDP-glucose 4-epimerase GalE [Celeribacter ethanolicus]ATG47064.1 UDP-glucose 4-epimerase [Celeribacter ethanolicus]TNE64706.1 MAG: UDP-glucose 4-epimerase GalE [Paracoccaceae bacterium]